MPNADNKRTINFLTARKLKNIFCGNFLIFMDLLGELGKFKSLYIYCIISQCFQNYKNHCGMFVVCVYADYLAKKYLKISWKNFSKKTILKKYSSVIKRVTTRQISSFGNFKFNFLQIYFIKSLKVKTFQSL